VQCQCAALLGDTACTASPAMAAPHPVALLLNQELAAVITAMRQNVKWALVPNRYLARAWSPHAVLVAQRAGDRTHLPQCSAACACPAPPG